MARDGGHIEGIERIMNSLNEKHRQLSIGGVMGMRKAAAFILNDAEKTSPTVPVDTGFLRASRFIDAFKNPTRPQVVFGYGANYAAFVHENVGATFKRKDAGAKFLEASLKRNSLKITLIIGDRMTMEGKLKR